VTQEVSGSVAVHSVLPAASLKVTVPVAAAGIPETLKVEVVPYGTLEGESVAVIVEGLGWVLGVSVALETASFASPE
jgi:hypothetical protein